MGTKSPSTTDSSLTASVGGCKSTEGALITPTPTDEEVAAIMAALGAAMSASSADNTQQQAPPSSRWRFSGRWWMSSRHGWRR